MSKEDNSVHIHDSHTGMEKSMEQVRSVSNCGHMLTRKYSYVTKVKSYIMYTAWHTVHNGGSKSYRCLANIVIGVVFRKTQRSLSTYREDIIKDFCISHFQIITFIK